MKSSKNAFNLKVELLEVCLRVINEGFDLTGDYSSDSRIKTLARFLFDTWQKQWPEWDKNDLYHNFKATCESGQLSSMAFTTLRGLLHSRYRLRYDKVLQNENETLAKLKCCEGSLSDFTELVIEGKLLENGEHWKIAAAYEPYFNNCKEFLSHSTLNQFSQLKNELKSTYDPREVLDRLRKPILFITTGWQFKQTKKREIFFNDLANQLLIEMSERREDCLEVLNGLRCRLEKKIRLMETS